MKKSLLFLFFLLFLPITTSAQDLIAYYSFDDCSAKDLSGYNNNGIIYGAICTEGKINQALSFDGIDDYINCGNSSILNPSSITITAWIYPKGWGENGMGRIVTKYSSYQFYVYSDGSRLSFYFWNSSNSSNQAWSNINSTKLNEWQHVAVTYDGQYVKFYVNGLLSGQATIKAGSLQPSTSNLIIGNRQELDRTFNGTIDEIKIYNRALSSEEIYSEYIGSAPQFVSINVTDETIGTVSKFTWGANLWSILDNNSLYDGLPKSGITLARIDMNLDHIFPTNTSPPNYDYLDKMINATKKIGIEPLIEVCYCPKWLSRNTSSQFYPPTNITKFAELVETVVKHIKDNVTYYGVWNEPNLLKYWNGTEVEYRELLIKVSQVIKKNDPDAIILAPSSSDLKASGSILRFMKEVCVNASNYFDIFSFHAYTFPPDDWIGLMSEFKQKLNEFGCGNKPLWMTEGGIWPPYATWDSKHVLQVAKARKILLDYDVKAQVYYPFKVYLRQEGDGMDGVYHGLYNSTNKSLTLTGKYYQLATNLKFYGNRLKIISSYPDSVFLSFLAVKNIENNVILQITNGFSSTKQIQINFPNIKNIIIYESSSDQVFDFPLNLGKKSSFNLTLKPYSVYLIKAEPSLFTLSGQLKDKHNNPLKARIIAYKEGTNSIIALNNTDFQGNYILSLPSDTYDILFNFTSFSIKVLSLKLESDIHNLIKNITLEERRIVFYSNISGQQIFQIDYINVRIPTNVRKNGVNLTKVKSLSELKEDSWFFDSGQRRLSIKINPVDCNSLCKAQGYSSGTCRKLIYPTVMKGANVPANHLVNTSLTYPKAYWALPEPDYAWKKLKELGVNVIQITGGTEGNVLRIQANEFHPWNRTYNPDWAENLEKLLAKADSYGMKVVFHTMGSKYGTLLGIVPPMHNYQKVEPYSSIQNALYVIDKLCGNNSLNKNFINDSRIAWWSPINEARIDDEYAYVREWLLAVLQKIKSCGGRTSVCVGWGDAYASQIPPQFYYASSFPKIIPIIGNYTDYLQAHVYCESVLKAASNNPTYNMYGNASACFSTAFKYMVSGRDGFDKDKLMVTEYGCGNGTWTSHPGTITTTEHQQAEYIKAAFDTAKKYGISKIFYHEPISINNTNPGFGFINYYGEIVPESFNMFKISWPANEIGCEWEENSIGQNSCPSSYVCCCV